MESAEVETLPAARQGRTGLGTMEIVRDQPAETWLIGKIKNYLEAQPRAKGIHVSDLLKPRKAYWGRRDPQPMTDHEAGYFVAGRGHHEVIEAIIEGSKKVGTADAGSHVWKGINYSPDMKTPHPQEIKTSRARFGPRNDTQRELASEYQHYLEQLTAYMAIDNDTEGGLLVFYLAKEQEGTKQTKPEFRWYKVTLTKAELGQRQAELLANKALLEKALKSKSKAAHRALPRCPQWLCRGCTWAPKCQPWMDGPGYDSIRPKRGVEL